MGAFTDTQGIYWALDLSKAAKIELFGLHYDINWQSLKNKDIIIKALNINDTFDIFSDDEIQCLQDKLKVDSFCKCK